MKQKKMMGTFLGIIVGLHAHGGMLYVAADATGAGDGSSWADAYTNIQDAVDNATTHDDVICIKIGDYPLENEITIPGSGGTTNLTLRGGYLGDGSPGTRTDDPTQTVVRGKRDLRVFYLSNVSGRIEGLTIADGNPQGNGAGLYLDAVHTVVTNCLLRNNANRGNFPGGGAYVVGGAPTFSDSTFFYNSGGYIQIAFGGGGIYVQNGAATVESCKFLFNAGRAGAGVLVDASAVGLFNCLFVGNTTGYRTVGGGGVHVIGAASEVAIENCSVVDNRRIGISREAGSVVIANSIVWGNDVDIIGDVTLSDSCVGGDTPGTRVIYDDPLFVPGYYLDAASPCANAGTVNAADLGLDGKFARVGVADSGLVDFGYHHSSDRILTMPDIHVNATTGDDGNDGISPETAFKTITHALTVAQEGSRIHLAAGLYNNANGESFPLRVNTHWIEIRGVGAEDTVIRRSALPNAQVLIFEAVGPRSLIEGVTLTGGHQSGNGMGLSLWRSSPVVSHCVITNNTGLYASGIGVYSKDGHPSFQNCLIADNRGTTSTLGGAIYLQFSVAAFENCVIRDNLATSAGAIYSSRSVTSLRNCLLTGNASNVSEPSSSQPDVILITETACELSLENCTVADNGGTYGISNISASKSGTLTIHNSIVWGNGENLVDVNPDDVAYSCIEGGAEANGNVNTAPLFVDSVHYHLQSRTGNYIGGYFSGGSWGKSSETCRLIDAGDPTSAFSNEPDHPAGRINMGAYGNTSVASLGALPGGTIILVK